MAPRRTRRPKGKVHVVAQPKRRRVTIDILPDDVLLEVFDLYVDPTRDYYDLETWCTLVHVCRRWRNIVLESPLRLNLRINCHLTTPVTEKLDIWPALPVVLQYDKYDEYWEQESGVVDVAAAFEQNHRICQIRLWCIPSSQMEEILAAMHKSFPALAHLDLHSEYGDPEMLVDPDLFLGGSAPCLRSLRLACIPFPGLPKLLLSATDLRDLNLSESGYISPEVMVSCLSSLTRLESLVLEESFESSESEHRRPPSPTRTLLPALTQLEFGGVGEYLEDLVVRIDAPLLHNLKMSLEGRFIHTAQLAQFINRTPKLMAHNEAHVVYNIPGVRLTLKRVFEEGLRTSHEVVALQVPSVAQVCTSSLPQAFSATLERLYICKNYEYWRGDIRIENNDWLELLRLFTSVKSLYLSRLNAQRIAPALQELIGERVAGVLPALETLLLEDLNLSGPVQQAIGSFVSGRQFSGYPVTVSQWNKGQVEL